MHHTPQDLEASPSPLTSPPHKPSLQSLHSANSVAELGHIEEALTRKFDTRSMLSLAFCVLGTWSTFAQGLSSGLKNGGPVAILWGLGLVFFCNMCVAVSLGELTSCMPTALGQGYWVHRLVDNGWGRGVNFLFYFIQCRGVFNDDGVEVVIDDLAMPWISGIVGITALFTVVNLIACRRDKFLPMFNNAVGVGFVGLFFVFALALLISVGIKRNMAYQSAGFVFGDWINQTGWSNGVVWFLGLLQSAYGLTAFDSVIHLVEEIPAPRKNAPRVIWLAVLLGAITGFIFMVVCLFCIQDLATVEDGPTGLPFIELVQQTVGLEGGATLIALFIFNGLGQGVSIATTGSRLTWGFARDGGIPWSQYFAAVNPTWKVPARALWLQGFIIALIGVLYLFANTVLEAVLSVSTIALTISYGMPIGCLLIVGRDKLPPGGQFSLGKYGPLCNWISVVYCSVTTVFFFFPGTPNPTPSDMNFAIAVFGVMLVIALGFWFITGKGTYLKTDDSAMRIELARRLEGDGPEVPVAVPTKPIK
ncbi:uncharacterized protein MYCFIDRAFT_154374 [Pseudocercospora fijiensis CIRAD86]|uniref:Amino acid permease/ SLC12A domain-containing protein n=1 Tax=Pseudocercospora fijiensis (strain CIRAD86) TaxID=383855 RepID=M2YVE1_PSEFD|nr:uncharacterized protein MYCFIDRAFT_154374 [Pseudocercospora fijiensis CIRAD86]EME81680.1 hypothetical protein MYCFIDRAFT_154374 [Pseudocercospora fijiensis CIRAD86]